MRSPSQQVGEGQPGATEPIVEPDAEVVQSHPRRQTRPQPPHLMGTLPPKSEGVEELVVDRLHDLTEGTHPPPQTLGPASLFGVAFGRMDDLGSVALQPTPVVFGPLKAFVGHVDPREGCTHAWEPRVGLSPHREEALGQRLVCGGGTAEAEAHDHPRRLYGGQNREALVPPYAVRPSDVGLPSEPSMSTALGIPDGHRRTIECLVGMIPILQHLPQLHGDLLDDLRIEAHETVELGAAWQCRECSSQMTISVAIEVPFAVEAAPAGEDSEGDDLALAEGGFRTRTFFRWLGLAKVVNHDIKCGEEGVHIEHELVPFPKGSGSRPTLECGCLPLKFRADNSHQAFKAGGVLHRPTT